ncbi:hypothetical protein LAG90_11080 [Marinilongibacter aquaticus]|uniref:hypothetical protein n=1 Tax=Marinilongibacter aquaticus TaxID=2975157 RepID=UPI0021BD00B3|nr:hypothetical protein [Marinilongibacter aquaticus]UBM57361.1 hypothetical protein LAG90_11080 [Marinilongibacter aquaticus]
MRKTFTLIFALSTAAAAYAQVEINPDYEEKGGEILLLAPENGYKNIVLQPDIAGTGGYFSVYDGNGHESFSVDGSNSLNKSKVRIGDGGQGSSFFNTYVPSGNGSVVLPINSISSPEIDNEPGVAMNNENYSINLKNDTHPVLSRTINNPSDGYVLVLASGRFEVNHALGTKSEISFGVSTDSTSLPPAQDLDLSLPPNSPSGIYYLPFSSHSIFPVSEGVETFYLVSDKGALSDIDAADITISCIFFPTKYGTVSGEVEVLGQSENTDDKTKKSKNALSIAEAKTESEDSLAQNQARMQKEIDELKAALAEITGKGNQP